MLEIDLLVGRWAKTNLPNFSFVECEKYNKEILSIETPELFRLLLNNNSKFEKNSFLFKIYNEAKNTPFTEKSI